MKADFRPLCSKCGSVMMLARIEPARPDYDLRSFECSSCNNVDQYIIATGASEPRELVVRG
jgi:hypothetical protein